MIDKLADWFAGKTRSQQYYELRNFIKDSHRVFVDELKKEEMSKDDKGTYMFVTSPHRYGYLTKYRGVSYGVYDVTLKNGELSGCDKWNKAIVTVTDPDEVTELKELMVKLHIESNEKDRQKALTGRDW